MLHYAPLMAYDTRNVIEVSTVPLTSVQIGRVGVRVANVSLWITASGQVNHENNQKIFKDIFWHFGGYVSCLYAKMSQQH